MEISPVDFLVCFILFSLALKIAYPLSGFFHELGHACAALLLKKKAKVRVYLGRHGEQPTVALGRLEIYAGPASSFWGTCEVESELNSFQTVIITAAGPLVSSIGCAWIRCII